MQKILDMIRDSSSLSAPLVSTFLERYHPESLHCEVWWPVPFLVILYLKLYARYQFTAGWTEAGQKKAFKGTSSPDHPHNGYVFQLLYTNRPSKTL